MAQSLNIAVEGCCHGELDKIYGLISDAKHYKGKKVDVLLVCGDFQSVRNASDLNCLAVPPKYRALNSFHEYVNGTKVAPVLTIFIGGNHEASNLLQNLYLGGWIAPNIYFLGYAGVITINKTIKIGGISGIYHHSHYYDSHYEKPPYSDDSLRSVYHIRELEVFRLAQYTSKYYSESVSHTNYTRSPVDIMLSHDWPQHIWNYGDLPYLLRVKPYFKPDIECNKLGNPPLMHNILQVIKPRYWFSAHLHVKFGAVVSHESSVAPATDALLVQGQSARPPPPAGPPPSTIQTSLVTPASATTTIDHATILAKRKLDALLSLDQSSDEEIHDDAEPNDDMIQSIEDTSIPICGSTSTTYPTSSNTLNHYPPVNTSNPQTYFLALDKITSGQQGKRDRGGYLEYINIPIVKPDTSTNNTTTRDVPLEETPVVLEYDLEWLAILRKTHHLLSSQRISALDMKSEEVYSNSKCRLKMPNHVSLVTDEDIQQVQELFNKHRNGSTVIPPIAPIPSTTTSARGGNQKHTHYYEAGNSQTDELLQLLELPHIWTTPSDHAGTVDVSHPAQQHGLSSGYQSHSHQNQQQRGQYHAKSYSNNSNTGSYYGPSSSTTNTTNAAPMLPSQLYMKPYRQGNSQPATVVEVHTMTNSSDPNNICIDDVSDPNCISIDDI